jgi:hypothetical protein
MSYPIKYPTPQGANIQIFQAPSKVATNAWGSEWVKPQGASFVWFTLIGAGGGSDSIATLLTGGGSGAVTNFMCPAFLIPDILQVRVGVGGASGSNGQESEIRYQQKNTTDYLLLSAGGGQGGGTTSAGGTPMTANYFTAMGFFQSVAGQAGINGAQSASTTTFLSGGSYAGGVTGNYGYTNAGNGVFQTQPIIVGTGGGSTTSGNGGIGCGGGGTSGRGGDGLAVIITW